PFAPTRATSSFGRSSIETPWTTTAFPYPPTMSRARRAGSISLPQVGVDYGRVLDGGFRLPVEEDLPLVHDQHSLHVIEEDLEPMLDDDEREAVFLPEADDRLEDFLRQLRRDAGGRLIEEQEPRLCNRPPTPVAKISQGSSVSIRYPRNVIDPASGAYTPVITLNNVDLPLPFGPMSPTSSPSLTLVVTPSTARIPPKRFRTSSS